jgi:hypothetical protein
MTVPERKLSGSVALECSTVCTGFGSFTAGHTGRKRILHAFCKLLNP